MPSVIGLSYDVYRYEGAVKSSIEGADSWQKTSA